MPKGKKEQDQNWNNRLQEMSHRGKEKHKRKFKSGRFANKEADGETWLLGNPHNMEMCAENDVMATFEKSVKFSFSSM
jgi:hypothetical protein